MKVTERDKICSKLLIEVLSNAKHDLKGSEVIAVARIMDWAADMKKRIEEDLAPKPAIPTPVLEPVVLEEPKKKRIKKDVRSE
jgi:hypothetical protein